MIKIVISVLALQLYTACVFADPKSRQIETQKTTRLTQKQLERLNIVSEVKPPIILPKSYDYILEKNTLRYDGFFVITKQDSAELRRDTNRTYIYSDTTKQLDITQLAVSGAIKNENQVNDSTINEILISPEETAGSYKRGKERETAFSNDLDEHQNLNYSQDSQKGNNEQSSTNLSKQNNYIYQKLEGKESTLESHQNTSNADNSSALQKNEVKNTSSTTRPIGAPKQTTITNYSENQITQERNSSYGLNNSKPTELDRTKINRAETETTDASGNSINKNSQSKSFNKANSILNENTKEFQIDDSDGQESNSVNGQNDYKVQKDSYYSSEKSNFKKQDQVNNGGQSTFQSNKQFSAANSGTTSLKEKKSLSNNSRSYNEENFIENESQEYNNSTSEYNTTNRLSSGTILIGCYAVIKETEALKLANFLKDKGFNSGYFYIPDYEYEGKKMYRVYTGPYSTFKSAYSELNNIKLIRKEAWVFEIR